MPFPPINKNFEGVLRDLLSRLTLVERRLARTGGGGGGGGDTVIDSMPAGTIVAWGNGPVPSGWALCDGQAVSRLQYPTLFARFGTAFGAGNGTTTFNLPNGKGRVFVGQDGAQVEFDTVGETGGEKSVTLTVAQMPRHSHIPYNQAGGAAGSNHVTLATGANDQFGVRTSYEGGDQAHNNLQPYQVIGGWMVKLEDGPTGGPAPTDTVPTGSISAWGTDTAPPGWLLCQGQAVSRATYSLLFAVIGTTYGAGDGSTTFNLPDLRGRVIVGKDAGQTEFDTLGEAGGAKTHTLTIAQMPSHAHGVQAGTNGYTGGVAGGLFFTNNPPTHPNYGGMVNGTGGDQAHNNLQPYRVLNYIIKHAPQAGGSSGGMNWGTAALRAATPSRYWEFWQDTDGTQKLYVGDRSGGWRQFSGRASVANRAWDLNANPIWARSDTVVLPTRLENNEDIGYQLMSAGTGYGVMGHGVITARGATTTDIALRFMQFANATTQSYSFTWWIVQ